MKKIGDWFVPSAADITAAIKEARAYANGTGNFIQLWFDTIDGKFHKEEFVDDNSWVQLPDYCYNIGMALGFEDKIAQDIEKMISKNQ